MIAKVKPVAIKQSDGNPVPVEVLAESIVAISAGVKKLRAGPLNERCLLLLIQNACPLPGKSGFGRTPVSQKDVKAVLDGMAHGLNLARISEPDTGVLELIVAALNAYEMPTTKDKP